MALLSWYGSPGFFDSGLQLICIFLSLVSHNQLFKDADFIFQQDLAPTHTAESVGVLDWPTNTFGSVGRCQILLENEISIFKKLVRRRKHEVLQNVLVNGCSDVGFQKTQWTNTSRWHCTPNYHRLWKLYTGLQATWAMSFSTLPPDSRTLVSKLNTKLALIWKEDFGPLGNSTVLLSPGKTPLTTTVAKFLDTSVCGGSWCLDPSLSPFLVKFTQILESILLDNPHKAAVLSVGCASFSSTHFLPLNFLLTCLDTALCEHPASLAVKVCGLPSLWRVSEQ